MSGYAQHSMTLKSPISTRRLRLVSLCVLVSWFLPQSAPAGPAKVREEIITLPTYKVGPPDPNPRFYSGRTYQGARATFYPYPVYDQMTEVREDQKYKAVVLENDFIQFSVLPELGGRIFTAVDKGNQYDFFYRQHVIKPALIGMIGAWISGGVEWNIPHHHRASSFLPVNYTVDHGDDGSKTVWVGETEWRHRMKWMVGMTLRPDRSYIEMTVKLFNRTPTAQSFLFWINPAVHANTNYQVIFPPSTEWAAQHSKPEFASWPIAQQRYGGNDYRSGVDISWWKNHPSPVSFFAWDCQEDFFGGYDHGREAGVAQISNHHVSPGKKFFEWGNGPEGEMWTKILSDEDGPYLELMAGSYSDNQPDYSWVQPGEVKVFKHFWYPIQKLGGLKNANTEAAVNLEVSNRVARVAFNTTQAHSKARVRLQAGDRVLLDKPVHISPRQPFLENVTLSKGTTPESLRASLIDESGTELISYRPIERPNTAMPKPVERPLAPAEITSAEQLYLTGLRIEQLYSPSFDAVPYYQEILKRDAGDYRGNTALGSLYCRQGRYEEAETLLRRASQRARENYIRPKTCEADYYLGVALRAQGKLGAAWDAFYRAIWDRAWQAAGYQALAELAARKGDFRQALELADESLSNGTENTQAQELKAALLRRLGRTSEARQVVQEIVSMDPLNPRALNEGLLLARRAGSARQRLVKALGKEANPYLELSMGYANCGLWKEAAGALEIYVSESGDARHTSPLVCYHLGYFAEQMGAPARAKDLWKRASQMPADFCFPFQYESETILRRAMVANPDDARASYYLGDLLFDAQPSEAIAAWERAVKLDGRFAPANRNVAFGMAQARKDVPGAIPYLEKAVSLDPGNPRLYYELDVLYEWAGTALQKRLEALNRRPEVVAKRDDALTRRIVVLTAAGKTEGALDILRTHHFRNWEGSSGLHGVYVDTCLQGGMRQLQKGEAAKALMEIRAATEYPANQEIGRPTSQERSAKIEYCLGRVYEATGQSQSAQEAFKNAADSSEREGSEGGYFRGLALLKVGQEQKAKELFEGMEKQGLGQLEPGKEAVDYFAKFGEKKAERIRLAQAHYMVGLARLGLSRKAEAEGSFAKALELDPAHLGALTWPLF